MTGCELTLFGRLPGGTVFERIQHVFQSVAAQAVRCVRQAAGKLNGFLAATAEAARSQFAGPLTLRLRPVGARTENWGLFDIVATDAYRDAGNAGTFRSELRKRFQHGKPLAVTEFGCCGYAGAADRGGMGWAIIDGSTDPPRLDGDHTRDESEQVRYWRS